MPEAKPEEALRAPFTQAMAQAKSAADEFARMFTDMKLPAVPDSEALMAAHKRNMDALTQANRAAMEGAQAVARRHMEIMQQTMAEITETMRALTASPTPQDRAAKQAELLKTAYERAVANTRELSELIKQANGEALKVLNQRFVEAVDEVKALMHQAAIPE